METVNKIKELFAAVVAVLTALWGWFGWMVLAWWFLMAMDHFTGSRAARRRGEWSSEKAREGVAHKAGELEVFIVALILDAMVSAVVDNLPSLPFHYTVLFSPLIVVWYILTEAGSVLENVEKSGTRLPAWISKLVSWLKGTVDQTANDAIPDGTDSTDHNSIG